MTHDPRFLAFKILGENQNHRITLDQLLDRFSNAFSKLSKRDRALANAIIHGTLRWQNHLDWILAAFSSRPIKEIQPEVLILLRMGLYQMVHMEKIPASAAVNTTVSIVKQVSHSGAAGFANALLRRAAEGHEEIPLPDLKEEPALFISVTRSLPLWLATRWMHRYGMDETLAIGDAVNRIPGITIRTNTLKTNRDELARALTHDVQEITATTHAGSGLSFSRPAVPIHEITAFKQGLFQVQDQAAQMISPLLSPRPGERILDACAGLGGKTGHLAQLMDNKGEIIAVDLDSQKLERLKEEMVRLGVSIVTTRPMNLMKPESIQGIQPFDGVLVDAPCSGLGVLRRNPDSRWKRREKDVQRMAGIQKKILFNAADLVKPGGRLVFAVCSCELEENQGVVQDFLSAKKEFTPVPPPLPSSLKREELFFKTYPHLTTMDGFFAAVFQKNNKKNKKMSSSFICAQK